MTEHANVGAFVALQGEREVFWPDQDIDFFLPARRVLDPARHDIAKGGFDGHLTGRKARTQKRAFADETGNFAGGRGGIEAFRRTGLLNLAVADHGHFVGKGESLALVVRDKQGRHLLRIQDFCHRLQQAQTGFQIEA